MRMQDSQANCGPVAVRNALCALGIVRSTEECEVLCGCTATSGTSPRKLYKGLEAIHEADPFVISDWRPEIALMMLEQCLRDGRPVIMLVDKAEHWVTAIGLLGKRVQVADGADSDLVISYHLGDLEARWRNPTSKRASFYAIRA